ncbi:hypothetical protein HY622_00150 [Candidatus Uhrbacteria bacterium]|nr:hypothetical protein [Candidatus Uhrbacteria bacterium]
MQLHTQSQSKRSTQIFFLFLFVVVGFIALQIPIAKLAGSKTAFTAYDAFAPIAGAFLGSIPGIIAVFLMQVLNFFVQGAVIQDAGTIIRFFPMLFAVWYFADKRKANIIVPMFAIVAFLLHPIGRQVWYFTLFWTIPIIAHVFRERFVFARALGATFSAHAVGGALWIWTFSMPASVWQSLIPVVILERFVFAVGITITFLAVSNALYLVEKHFALTSVLRVDTRFVLRHLRDAARAQKIS